MANGAFSKAVKEFGKLIDDPIPLISKIDEARDFKATPDFKQVKKVWTLTVDSNQPANVYTALVKLEEGQ